MATTQKDRNSAALYALVALNTAILYGLVTTQRAEPGAWLHALTGIQTFFPTALAVALTGVLNSLLSPHTKARLVFCEWEHPLPGSRAFSHFLARDTRINFDRLQARFGPFPHKPMDQNRRWYEIYRSVDTHPAVADANRAYLFARDYAALVALMLPLYGLVAMLQVGSPLLFILYTAVLLMQLLIASRAARINGARLVTNAMATASTIAETP